MTLKQIQPERFGCTYYHTEDVDAAIKQLKQKINNLTTERNYTIRKSHVQKIIEEVFE